MKRTSQALSEIKRGLNAWKLLKSNWIVSLSEKFVFVLFIVSMVLLVLQWKHLPPLVPLWYNKSWGTEQLADPHYLFILPVMGLCVHLLNAYISVYLVSEYLVFTQMASLTSLLVSALSSITLIKILFLIS